MSGFVLLCAVVVAMCSVCFACDARVTIATAQSPERGGQIVTAICLTALAIGVAYAAGRMG